MEDSILSNRPVFNININSEDLIRLVGPENIVRLCSVDRSQESESCKIITNLKKRLRAKGVEYRKVLEFNRQITGRIDKISKEKDVMAIDLCTAVKANIALAEEIRVLKSTACLNCHTTIHPNYW
jgi:hypothetical protein